MSTPEAGPPAAGHDGGEPGDPFAAAAEGVPALDLLLSDAALGVARRFRPGTSLLRLGLNLARQPGSVARRAGTLGAELGKITAGRSALAPAPRDRRFTDQAWAGNPFLRRIVQLYLAGTAAAEGLLADAELGWRDAERAGFPGAEPGRRGRAQQQPGASARGLEGGHRHRRAERGPRDPRAGGGSRAPARIPAMVSPDAFEVGRDLAVTPGAVVARTGICELIQYQPTTPRVHQFPLVIVPPDDQQVLYNGSFARTQPGRVPGVAGPSGVRPLVAQPRCPAPGLGPGRLRPGGGGRAGHRPGSAGRRRPASSRCARAASCPPWWPRT